MTACLKKNNTYSEKPHSAKWSTDSTEKYHWKLSQTTYTNIITSLITAYN